MVTRLSSQFMHYQKMNSMMYTQGRLSESEQRLMTGKRNLQSADDPIATAEVLQLNQSQARSEQFQTARQSSQQSMRLQMTTVGQMNDVALEIKQVFVAVGNQSIINDSDRQIYADTLESLKNRLFDLANSKAGFGNFMFAGYKTDNPPLVDNNGQITYQGGTDAIKQSIDVNREVTVSFTAEQVLQPAGGKDIFATLDLAIRTLKTPYQSASSQAQDFLTANINAAHNDLNDSMNTLSNIASQLGLQLKDIESLDSRHKDVSLLATERLNQLNNVDLVAEITEYHQQFMVLQACQSLYIQTNNLSLFKMRA